MTHQEAAEAVGRSRAAVSNLLRLRNLNDEVKRLVENCDLEMGHARALLALEGQQQSETALHIVEKGLSVRETEQLIRRILKPAKEKPQQPENVQDEVNNIENIIREKLGERVAVKHSLSGKGKLIINYDGLAELKKLAKKIK